MATAVQAQIRAALQDEATLKAALQEADIAPLLMVLVQLSGDLSLLEEAAPHITGPWNFLESVPDELKQRIRDRLLAVLRNLAAGTAPPPLPDDAVLQRMMGAGVGQPVPAEYIPLLKEEMRFTARDTRWVDWHGARPAAADRFPVLVVGAGIGGIATAIQLKRLGIPFTVLEKNQDIGGTWLENSYPGCAVDTPNHFYSFSFRPHDGWTRHFSGRDEILGYIRDTVDEYGIREHIRLGVEVTDARFDGKAGWQVSLRRADGGEETLQAAVLVTAVGQLNRPAFPDIPGLKDFAGPCFHTAEWDHSVSLDGKRVAMIGTGASAMQAGPSIAPKVAHLTVFQRAAHWVVHNPNYHRSVKPGHIWLLRHLPFYSQWLRFQLFWASSDGFHATLRMDPNWSQPAISLNERNHAMREMLLAHMRQELDGDEALLAKVTPTYPPYGKRMLRDNYWFRMLKRPNVTLETGRIARITADAIEMQDGARHAVDAIVLATGFQASRMLTPMNITGRDGITIRDAWGEDDPRAYLGMTAPGFPNLFMLYGPNTNLAHGGSIIFHTECQVRYIMQALRSMVENDTPLLEIRRDVHDRYNAQLDEVARNMVWTHPGVTSWYKNKHNRLTVTSPWRLLDYWRMTKEFAPQEFNSGKAA